MEKRGNSYHTIILPSRPQPDTIVGIFLLKKFGKESYPGLNNTKIEIWQELPENETVDSLNKKGVLVLDLGGGKFDHHKKNINLSKVIAADLGVAEKPALQKLLNYAERDDRHGLGTISTDPI